MNPFTESTVARPLSEGAQAHESAHSSALPQPGSDASPSTTEAAEPPGAANTRRLSHYQALGWRSKGRAVSAASARMLLALGIGLAVAGVAHALDVNTATAEQLRAVRGIGPKTAQLIIEERTRGGKYESFDDFSERVKGIGSKKAAALQASGLTVGGARATAGVAGAPASNSSASTRTAATASGRMAKAATK